MGRRHERWRHLASLAPEAVKVAEGAIGRAIAARWMAVAVSRCEGARRFVYLESQRVLHRSMSSAAAAQYEVKGGSMTLWMPNMARKVKSRVDSSTTKKQMDICASMFAPSTTDLHQDMRSAYDYRH